MKGSAWTHEGSKIFYWGVPNVPKNLVMGQSYGPFTKEKKRKCDHLMGSVYPHPPSLPKIKKEKTKLTLTYKHSQFLANQPPHKFEKKSTD
jgi:hypothetical protein